MQSEPGGQHPLVLGKRGLGVDLLAVAPRRAQAAERLAVVVAVLDEPGVELVDRHLLAALRRPDREVEIDGGPGRGEHTAGIAVPRSVVTGPGMEPDRAGAVGVERPDHDLQPHLGALGKHERLLDQQLLDAVAAELVARAQGQFQESGAGEQGCAGDRVVGQPRVRPQREPAGEHEAVFLCDLHHRPEQRVTGGGEAGGADVHGVAVRLGPEPFPLEGVGGQVDRGA